MTKRRFVELAENAVKAAFYSYEILRGMNNDRKDAVEMVIQETGESASCWMGVGSCGGGGCKHG